MRAPIGVVPGLCTASTAYLAIGSGLMVFLIRGETEVFTTTDLIAAIIMTIALIFIGLVPWIISKPVSTEMGVNLQPARKCLALGTFLFFTAIMFQILTDYYESPTKESPSTTQISNMK